MRIASERTHTTPYHGHTAAAPERNLEATAAEAREGEGIGSAAAGWRILARPDGRDGRLEDETRGKCQWGSGRGVGF